MLLRPEWAGSGDGAELFGVIHEEDARCGAPDWLERLLALERRFFLQDYMLVKADRASMGHGLEVRNPFLATEIVEFAANLPLGMKLHRLTTKHVLRRAFADVLPAPILRRPKQGFAVPVARWLSGELKEYVVAMLDPKKLAREGFFNVDEVQRLLAEHFAKRANHYKKLWTLLMFEGWLEHWGPGRMGDAPAASVPAEQPCGR